MKKIVFFDLDRTLLTSTRNILQENIEAIKKARESGIEVCICSARQQESVKVYQQMAGAGRYIICNNGAEIYDTEGNEELYAATLEEEVCIKLFEYAMKNNFFIRIDTKYGRYINIEEYRMLDFEMLIEEDYKKFFKENKILQFTMGSFNKELIDNIEIAINETIDIKVVNRFISSIIPVRLNMIEIANKSSSKGNAVSGLCKYLKIDLKDAVAFGDDHNDIPMLEVVGHAVVMGNASDDVKKIADEVIENNNEPGIAKVLERIISEN